MSLPRMIRLAGTAISLICGCALHGALAQSSYDLRALNVSYGFTPNTAPGNSDQKYQDLFDNGNPLVGPAYKNGITGTGSYGVFGTPSAGVELSSQLLPVGAGRMRFQLADAAPNPTNLDAPGTMGMSERLGLAALPTPLLTAQTSFEVSSFWNFVTPDAGTFYGLRLADNPFSTATPGSPFDDLIDLRVIRSNAGSPLVQLRRVVYDGVSTLSVTESYLYDPATVLQAGKTFADVAFIGLEGHYNAPDIQGATMLWSFYLVDASGDNVLGKATFAQRPALFHGETTTRLIVGANWTVPVPEPGTWALMLAGIAGLGVYAGGRRR